MEPAFSDPELDEPCFTVPPHPLAVRAVSAFRRAIRSAVSRLSTVAAGPYHPRVIFRVHVLACGVLAADLRVLAGRLPARLTLDLLPGKLHNTPHDLRRRLQERIDAVSAAGGADAIAIAYGICGRGTVGLAARAVPLWIPRVHDCIALFLGSDAAYREQVARYPGTYYVSAGWV